MASNWVIQVRNSRNEKWRYVANASGRSFARKIAAMAKFEYEFTRVVEANRLFAQMIREAA